MRGGTMKYEYIRGAFALTRSNRRKRHSKAQVHNRGRVVKERWALGLFNPLYERRVIVHVLNRSAETLLEEIQKFVLPGTEIWTDEWAGYRQLKNLTDITLHVEDSKSFQVFC